jgi:hypothetical protein
LINTLAESLILRGREGSGDILYERAIRPTDAASRNLHIRDDSDWTSKTLDAKLHRRPPALRTFALQHETRCNRRLKNRDNAGDRHFESLQQLEADKIEPQTLCQAAHVEQERKTSQFRLLYSFGFSSGFKLDKHNDRISLTKLRRAALPQQPEKFC